MARGLCSRSARAQVERKSLSCWNRCIPLVAIRFARGSIEAAAVGGRSRINRGNRLCRGPARRRTHTGWSARTLPPSEAAVMRRLRVQVQACRATTPKGRMEWTKRRLIAKRWDSSRNALTFICGADHPTTIALKAAAESGTERDIKKARTLFLRLKPSDRRAALTMLND